MILAAVGSPDVRQIDGLGGAHPLTSKIAIVEPGARPDTDVAFTFGQVAIDRPLIDYSGTCGNISSAIGPWAIEAGLVDPVEPETTVRVLNLNTNKTFIAHVPVRDGRPFGRGDHVVDGVPNPGAAIRLEFLEPGGGVTGSLLPTGQVRDRLRIQDREVEVSVLDVGNPTVLVDAAELELPEERIVELIRTDAGFRGTLLSIREEGGRLAGLTRSDGMVPDHIPKVAVVASPAPYRTLDGRQVERDAVDLRAWALTMGQFHQAYPVTAAMPTAVAVHMAGSIAAAVAGASPPRVRIGHPSGVIEVEVTTSGTSHHPRIECVAITRTARRIMTGDVMLP
jgi:hypothetical protein